MPQIAQCGNGKLEFSFEVRGENRAQMLHIVANLPSVPHEGVVSKGMTSDGVGY